MKKLLLFILITLTSFFSKAQTQDVIYLKNGNVVRGIIIEQKENGTVTIRTNNGRVLTYTEFDIREITIEGPPAKQRTERKYTSFEDQKMGYFFATELGFDATMNKGPTIWPVGLSVVNGFRANEFISVGCGIGLRYYFNNGVIRKKDNEWAFPVYFDIRGNIVSHRGRNLVPYWSFDTGLSFGDDNLFFSPTIGLSIGGYRNNLIVGLSYLGQFIDNIYNMQENDYHSMVGLKVGFQF